MQHCKLLTFLVMLLLITGCTTGPPTLSTFTHQQSIVAVKVTFVSNTGYIHEHGGAASGSVIEYAGAQYILTAEHVTTDHDGSSIAAISIHFGPRHHHDIPPSPEPATLVSRDKQNDVALLRFTRPNFHFTGTPLRFAPTSRITVGTSVIAVGHPRTSYFTYTNGVIMNLDVGIGSESHGDLTLARMIEHTALLNNGNSGGPLLNHRGEIIGMNIEIRRVYHDYSYENSTYLSVPGPLIIRLLPRLTTGREIRHATLNIGLQNSWEISPFGFTKLEIPEPKMQGVIVTAVPEPTDAYKQGIRPGDIILTYDGHTPCHFRDILDYVMNDREPGDVVRLKILKPDGKILTITVKTDPLTIN